MSSRAGHDHPRMEQPSAKRSLANKEQPLMTAVAGGRHSTRCESDLVEREAPLVADAATGCAEKEPLQLLGLAGLFLLKSGDVEHAKLLYLSQFAHTNCGGQPEIRRGSICCTACKKVLGPFDRALGKAIEQTKAFERLV